MSRLEREGRVTGVDQLRQDGVYVMHRWDGETQFIKIVGADPERINGAQKIFYVTSQNGNCRNGQGPVWGNEMDYFNDTDFGLTPYDKSDYIHQNNWLQRVEKG